MAASDTHGAINAVFRIEQAKRIAGLVRMVRDVGLAEELAQDALVTALEQWPDARLPDTPGGTPPTPAQNRRRDQGAARGSPPYPGGGLWPRGKNRAIDRLRRHKLADRKHEAFGAESDLL